jgi:hypothetical protein
MTRHNKQKSTGKRLRSLYLWHRWIGMLSAAFVILLALTGLALNHTEEMALDSRYVQSSTLLDWYGIRAPKDITAFSAGGVTIAAVGNRVYVDAEQVANIEQSLIGAVFFSELIILAITDKLLLLTRDGELVEEMGAATGIPAGIRAIGTNSDRQLVISTANGFHSTDSELLAWQEITQPDARWSEPVTPDPLLVTALQTSYRGNGLPVERVMLDLHSGRILGPWGVYLMDGAAIVFLLLACSGIWLWGKRRASARAHRRRVKTQSHAKHHSAESTTASHRQQHKQSQQ